MGTVRYTVIDGEIIAEKRNGVRSLYVPDPLGSTVALLDNTQAQTDTFSYWSYGENNGRTGTTATPFQFIGTQGYFRDSSSRKYVRARSFAVNVGRWLEQDPIGFDCGDLNLYAYSANSPVASTDPTGLQGEGLPTLQCGQSPKPDIQDYGTYCGAKRHPYPDKWPTRPTQPPESLPLPKPYKDQLDRCCVWHDLYYWYSNCKTVIQPGQTPYCHNLDLKLCECWKKHQDACDVYDKKSQDYADCNRFLGKTLELCALIKLRGATNWKP